MLGPEAPGARPDPTEEAPLSTTEYRVTGVSCAHCEGSAALWSLSALVLRAGDPARRAERVGS